MEQISAIKVQNLNKVYRLYNKPIDRMKEALSLTKKKYGKDHYALKNINFEVKKGDTVGIVGTNGSGKSTILKIITGVLTPTFGTVEVNGRISALLELGAGFNPEYTGIENIYLNGTMMGYTKEEMKKRVQPIMDFADIGEFINQPVKTYSSGMFARLAFAVAINVEPEILIVDEALAVGDVRFQIKCMDRMKHMMEGGTTVLFVSHDITSIKKFCKKAVWLDRGILKSYGDVDRVCDQYLDFLKCIENKDINKEVTKEIPKKVNEEKIEKKQVKNNNIIAEIIDFQILNKDNKIITETKYNEFTKIRVKYNVYDEKIKKPVLGIALKRIDDEYTCGLNTLLDNVDISWHKGINMFELEYEKGILAISGKYYFDVALFEQTAVVPIQYISKIKTILVTSKYIGEGRYIIPHKWRNVD
ncbi:ABC transporter ATP-binding protein [Clostridium sp. BJN0001]|uniref:ABC transporter ATP-binding protein n=1 Tax=Clostridium sp. BJN0001 TaxID=2930219 RepID=UPI001FD1A9DC|nr:ABC transporter ATP-binding protein [Clostridium sp. BJN0001]